ncbi:hypothetical protein [Fodinicola acaciae]|uniref:hypothetical protein n=1 Tax=Fodinicola acaciae TaxID=2681555 RepID=UPI0013D78DAE|nr:hypothetical protein [Fodinicola acaciae]
MSFRSGRSEAWKRSYSQALTRTGVPDPAAQKDYTAKQKESLKGSALSTSLSIIGTGVGSASLLLTSGIAAFADKVGPSVGGILGAAGLALLAKAVVDLRASQKKSQKYQQQRQRGQRPEAEPLNEIDRVEHESTVRDEQIEARLDAEGRQRTDDLNEISNAITTVAESTPRKDEVYTKAEVQGIVQQAIAQATAPLHDEIRRLHDRVTREEAARQVADANVQADVARVDAEVSETSARVTDTQAVTNDLTNGLNHVNDRLDGQGRVVNQHADVLNHFNVGLGGLMQVSNAHADNLDTLGRQQAGEGARRGRRGDPANQPPAPAARAHPVPPPPPGQPGTAETVRQEPWGAQQNQKPEPFPNAQRRQQGPQPGQGRPSGSPTPAPQPGRGPRPPRR